VPPDHRIPDAPAMPEAGPFAPEATEAYARWREMKLRSQPQSLDELIVELQDPRRLTPGEREALTARCKRANMALYISTVGDEAAKDIPLELGRQLGLVRLDSSMGADDDGITSLEVAQDGSRDTYIPYTDRPIHWHTDGYYNTPVAQIRGLILHCVRPAARGGANALMDSEMAYLLLRDRNPNCIRALMAADAMTIPANVVDGRVLRPSRTGPVFRVGPDGRLHMRYTKRLRNVIWREDPITREAVARLAAILDGDSPAVFRATLQAGWGLVCNNVLHDRAGFRNGADAQSKRLLYRARYYDRVADT